MVKGQRLAAFYFTRSVTMRAAKSKRPPDPELEYAKRCQALCEAALAGNTNAIILWLYCFGGVEWQPKNGHASSAMH
jgi:hypothetical protein